MVKNEYDKQAEDFLKATKTTINIKFDSYRKYFPQDKEKRDVYKITFKRGNGEYAFNFGNSVNDSGFEIIGFRGNTVKTIPREVFAKFKDTDGKNERYLYNYINRFSFVPYRLSSNKQLKLPKEPSNYDILACLDVLYDDNFEEFCSSFGYDTDSRQAEKTYNAVLAQSNQLKILFNDKEIEKLAEIA